MRQLETSLLPVWMEEGGYGWGTCRTQLPGLQSGREKRVLSQNLKKTCYLSVRKHSHTLPAVTCCCPYLGATLGAPTTPACCGGVITVRSHVSVKIITVRSHVVLWV